MALIPNNENHRKQILAGTTGRNKGHRFEDMLSKEINECSSNIITPGRNSTHIYCGNPAKQLLQYIANTYNIIINSVKAYWLGGLATSNVGDTLIDDNGEPIKASKSDVIIIINPNIEKRIVGVSVKTCNNKIPTNDQMFFTTASAFCNLLRNNNINVSKDAEIGLSMFCGDEGYQPKDIMNPNDLSNRKSDPNRYYWEELSCKALKDWNEIFTKYQDQITLLLFQKAYKNDPYPPEFLLHQTVKYDDFNNCQIAIFSMEEIVKYSRNYANYYLSNYSIRKGTFKNDPSIHKAPKFGFIQFQRGGQKQHPTQLQFNLKAGYFNHLN